MMWKFWLTRAERKEMNRKHDEEMGRRLAEYAVLQLCASDLAGSPIEKTIREDLARKDDYWCRSFWQNRPEARRRGF